MSDRPNPEFETLVSSSNTGSNRIVVDIQKLVRWNGEIRGRKSRHFVLLLKFFVIDVSGIVSRITRHQRVP